MLKNYIVTALRAMLRNKLASLITILGLALSLACVFLLALFVQFETSFEAFHAKRDRLCRVIIQGETFSKETNSIDVNPVSTGMILGVNFDAIVNTVTLAYDTIIVGVGDEAFTEDVTFAEDSFLEMFTFPLAQGDSHTALAQPKSMIITPEAAERYFGATNPLGQTVTIRSQLHPEPIIVTITGIFHTLPRNNSILRESVLSFDVYVALQGDVEGGLHGYTYIELQQAAVFAEVKDAIREHHLDDLWAKSGFETFHVDIERISDIHLYSRVGVPAGSLNPRLLLVSLVLFAAILILVIACINVTNLLIAGFSKRAKEVGLRKVVGAQHGQLIGQFLVEALVLCSLAFVAALMLTEVLLPQFNTLVHQHLALNMLSNPGFWVAMLGVTLMVGVLAGMYPAFVLAALKPVSSLQGERLPSTKHLRKILVVVQFIASVVLLIASGVIAREITFLKNKPLGFETRNMLIVEVNVPKFVDRYETFKAELLKLPEVAHVTASSNVAWTGSMQSQYPVEIPGIGRVDAFVLLADPDYLETYDIPLLEGSGFSDNQLDSNSVLISESAKRAFGWTRTPGKALNLSALADPRSNHGLVVGVVKDFQYVYPMQRMSPLLIVQRAKMYSFQWIYVSIRFHDRVEQAQRAQIEDIWKKIFPTLPFQAELLETRIARHHNENLEPLSASLQAATGFALFTAYLGLFGLASYETARRTKEVGIRKALGATSAEVVAHFVKSFVMLALIANVIAWPLAFFLIRLIFRAINYPYPLRMGPLVFLQAGAISVILAIVTVSVQTLRAASVNPVNALRYE